MVGNWTSQTESGMEIETWGPMQASAVRNLRYLESIGQGINPLGLRSDLLREYLDPLWTKDYEEALYQL